MSRIGKKPVIIPEGVSIEFNNNILIVKGSKGELKRDMSSLSPITINDNIINVKVPTLDDLNTETGKNKNSGKQRLDKKKVALCGLTRALINNMVLGVEKGFEKVLRVVGTGYKAELKGKDLLLKVGFSHDVLLPVPLGLKAEDREETIISITGIDNQLVGEFAARIHSVRKTNPYSGKGIRYRDEVVRRKERKAGV